MLYVKSTDRDLLIAQRSLGRLRHPNMSDADLVKLVEKSKNKLAKRFVDIEISKPKSTPGRKALKFYEMTISFMNNVRVGDVTYKLDATFRMKNVPGEAALAVDCADNAKEEFRKRLGNLIRDSGSELHKKFFNSCKVEVVEVHNGKNPGDKDRQEKAKEAFRKWIGNEIRDQDSTIYKQFFKMVAYKEMYQTRKCKECNLDKAVLMFFPGKEELTHFPALKAGVCTKCQPIPEIQEEVEDGDEDDEYEDVTDETEGDKD